MRPQHDTSPRKRPRQARSKATVEAIVEAVARVLVEQGPEAASTNRVAARAGVSVGSLYQYFPNKESLLRAVLERHLDHAVSLRPAELDLGRELPLRDRLRVAVRWHLDVHACDPELHQVLTQIAPDIFGVDVMRDFERAYFAVIREAIEPYRDDIRPTDLDLAAFVVAQCMESLTHGAVLHHPDLLPRTELETEITEVLCGYLGV